MVAAGRMIINDAPSNDYLREHDMSSGSAVGHDLKVQLWRAALPDVAGPSDAAPGTARRHLLRTAVALTLAGTGLAVPARAAQLVEVDVRPLETAYRASKLIGATVVNDKNQSIGHLDDLIITPNQQVLFAVISVGGFLGINGRLVAVPFSSLKIDDKNNKVVLPGATKEALTKLPAFHYG